MVKTNPSPEEVHLIERRAFDFKDICSMFGVRPEMVMPLNKKDAAEQAGMETR